MGVVACSRVGCDNIMCDFVSHEHGYLCYWCRKELIERGPCDIQDFLGAPNPSYENIKLYWESIVKREFKSRYEDEE